MNQILVLETGLFNETDQLDQAIYSEGMAQYERRALDPESMSPSDWDALLERIMLSTSVITL